MKIPHSSGAVGLSTQGASLTSVKFDDSNINVKWFPVGRDPLSPYKGPAVGGTSTAVNPTIFPPKFSFSNNRQIAVSLGVADELARLPPGQRWQYLFAHKKSQLFLMVLAVLAWFYAATAMFPFLHVIAGSFGVGVAKAESSAPVVPPEPWISTGSVFLCFLGLFIVWSLATVTFSKTSEKIQLASDAVKTLLGFLVGYFTSPKVS
ncbi:hypothetical protein [Mesorhizobium sp. M0633]|uniref:hypothetical protein n=1 Tax=Mesorhizobium sp. M0633 TaxID=2956977 RepID=UPI00333B9990